MLGVYFSKVEILDIQLSSVNKIADKQEDFCHKAIDLIGRNGRI